MIKADGLAAGKGVVVAESAAERDRAIDAHARPSRATRSSIEEFLEGEEASLFVLTDGKHVLPLAGAQDHKRAFDGDKGPNTGGMGAYSPAPVLTPDVTEKALARIVRPTIAAMAARGTPYMGVLYAGLMIKDGEPKLIEYNCRFGDPECQVLMMRLKSDLATALSRRATASSRTSICAGRDEVALTVVMAARGLSRRLRQGLRNPQPGRRRTESKASRSSMPPLNGGTASCSPPAAGC